MSLKSRTREYIPEIQMGQGRRSRFRRTLQKCNARNSRSGSAVKACHDLTPNRSFFHISFTARENVNDLITLFVVKLDGSNHAILGRALYYPSAIDTGAPQRQPQLRRLHLKPVADHRSLVYLATVNLYHPRVGDEYQY